MPTHKKYFIGASLILVFMIYACGGAEGGSASPTAIKDGGQTLDESPQQPATAAPKGSFANPLDIHYIDLPILSHISGEVVAMDMNDAHIFAAQKFLIDVYDSRTNALIKRVVSKKMIRDLRVQGNSIFVITHEWDNGDVMTLYRFDISNVADYLSASSLILPSSASQFLYSTDEIYIGDRFSSAVYKIRNDENNVLIQESVQETPLRVSKMDFYQDYIIFYGREPSLGRDEIIVADRNDFSVIRRLYSDHNVREFAVSDNGILAAGVGSDIRYHDLNVSGFPLVQTTRNADPQCLTANRNFIAAASHIQDGELFLLDVRDVDNIDVTVMDLSGPGGVFDADFRWSSICNPHPILWRNRKMILNGLGDQLVFLSSEILDSAMLTVETTMPQRTWHSPLDIHENEIVYATGRRVEVWNVEDPNRPTRRINADVGNNTRGVARREDVYYVQRLNSLETWQLDGSFWIRRDESVLATESEEILTGLKMYGSTAYVPSNRRLYLLFNNSGPRLSHTMGIIERNTNNGFFIKDNYIGINSNNSSLEVFDIQSFLGDPTATFDLGSLGPIWDSLNTNSALYLTPNYKKLNIMDPLAIEKEMETSLFFNVDDLVLQINYVNGVADHEKSIIAYLRGSSFDEAAELFFFRIQDNQPEYLGTAVVPIAGSNTNLYLRGDLLLIQNETDGIFLFRWPFTS